MPQLSDNPHAVRLGRQLRRLRQAAGYTTQTAFGPRIGYGDDSISKVEKGRRVPTRELLTAWLGACEKSIDGERRILTDGEREAITELWEAASEAQRGVPEFFEKYVEAEAKATFLRLWGLLLIPGPLQTREYAHAMFITGGMDEDEAAERTEARIRRHAKIDGPDAAHVTALIYEPVLHRLVGTPEVMIGQLEHLLEVSQRRNVIVQVVPDTGYFPGLDGEFAIASGPEIADTVDMITLEDHVTNAPALVGKAIAWFEVVRGYALNVAESRAFITEAIEQWKSQQQ
jgi:transcriptional regulator with XRE-family HTH domain